MASIHTYATGTGERRYLVRWREDTKERGRSFQRKRDAERWRADVERRKQLGTLYEADPETVGEFLASWFVRYRQRVKPPSAKRREDALRSLPDALRARTFATLRAAEVEDAVSAVATRAPRQAQIALASLKLVAKDARRRGHRIDEGILEIQRPRANGRPARFLTWAEVCHLASFMSRDEYNRLVRLAGITGARQGELLALVVGDIDLQARTLTIREGKTAAARRTVDLAPTAVKILREQMKALTEGEGPQAAGTPGAGPRMPARVVGSGSPSASAPLFPAPRGGHLDGHNWYVREFLPATRAAGLEGVTFHALRHSYISLMAKAGVHPSVIAGQVGHTDGGALLLKTYRHLFPDEGRAAAKALEGLVGK